MGNDCFSPDLTPRLDELNKTFNETIIKNIIFYDELNIQKKYYENYKAFVSELNYQLNDLKDQLNISISEEKNTQNILSKEENIDLLNDLESITNRINEYNSLIENQKTELKNIESNFNIIQQEFTDIKANDKNKSLVKIKIKSIEKQLSVNENIVQKLDNNKLKYEEKKKEIENDIELIQSITKEKVFQIKNRRKKTIEKMNIDLKKSDSYNEMNDSLFLKGSMLLNIKDFSTVKNLLKSMYVFKKSDSGEEIYDTQRLLRKDWHEICYINDDYDLHDVNYKLEAVGLSDDMAFTSSSFNFSPNYYIDILYFDIDGKKGKKEYEYEGCSLRFKINLKNYESSKIHIKYRETFINDKLSEDEKVLRKVSRSDLYGISRRLYGQKAKYILKNESNFEIINFEEEFFIKTKENEYQWGGKVPEGGRETLIRFSKKEGKINFYEKYSIKTVNNSRIKDTIIQVPCFYFGGNNQTIKYNYSSEQTKIITLDSNKRIFQVTYLNTNSNIGEFIIEGELKNRCNIDWIFNLTNEEIDSLIPNDYKANKELYKQIANKIIKQYDDEHKNDPINIHNANKIGKWIKQNIKYDISYAGLHDITAMQIYKEKKGVCHHYTILFNALMYSLGYQVLYVFGYALERSNKFGSKDSHAWSLIKIDGKWKPFDSTWGIFSGKLPVTHVYKKIGYEGIQSLSNGDKIKIENPIIEGIIN